MAKSRKVSLSLFELLALGLAVVALVMFTLPFVHYEATILIGKVTENYSGFDLAFGKGNLEVVVVALFAFLLIVFALVALLARLFVRKEAKTLGLAGSCLLIVAGILIFFTLSGFYTAHEITGGAKDFYSLTVGAFLSAFPAIGAGALAALDSLK